MFMELPIASPSPILSNSLASKSSARNTDILVSLGCLNRRFILECEAESFDPLCEPFEGLFQKPTKMKI
jgi:hypothetical protein